MNLFQRLFPALAVVLFCSPSLTAQTGDAATPPEEIIVTAPENLRNLRLDINRAAENMFGVFNALNDDDLFDVHCRYVRRWQSKIRQQVCRPVFLDNALEDEANTTLGALGHAGAERGLAGVSQVDHYNAIFEEKMKTVFREHPEFREAMNEYTTLVEDLEEARKARFGKDD